MNRMTHSRRHLAALIAAAALPCLPATDADAQAQLVYDSGTGQLSIDPTVVPGGITGYVLQLDAGASFTFDPGNFTPVIPDSVVSTAFATDLGESGLSALSSPASLGEVLPTGLTLTQLDDALIFKDYNTGLGGTGEFIVVPEPSSLATFLLISGLAARRRR